jgi:predicted RNase H-like HicB family nuclease
MERVKLPVILTQGEDGYIVAEVPILPGCISQGRTKREALANVREAAELCLESMEEEEGWTLPKEYALDQVEVSA